MPPRRQTQNIRDPIRWSPDPLTVLTILDYCERQPRRTPRTRNELAYREIIDRIYGNLINSNRRAYPSEIGFDTVARSLTSDCGDTPSDNLRKAGLIAALEAEWPDVREYFKRKFLKPDVD